MGRRRIISSEDRWLAIMSHTSYGISCISVAAAGASEVQTTSPLRMAQEEQAGTEAAAAG